MKNGDKPAYPVDFEEEGDNDEKGLTKLEAFTLAAMQGLLSCESYGGVGGQPYLWAGEEDALAERCVDHAKATLAALEADNE